MLQSSLVDLKHDVDAVMGDENLNPLPDLPTSVPLVPVHVWAVSRAPSSMSSPTIAALRPSLKTTLHAPRGGYSKVASDYILASFYASVYRQVQADDPPSLLDLWEGYVSDDEDKDEDEDCKFEVTEMESLKEETVGHVGDAFPRLAEEDPPCGDDSSCPKEGDPLRGCSTPLEETRDVELVPEEQTSTEEGRPNQYPTPCPSPEPMPDVVENTDDEIVLNDADSTATPKKQTSSPPTPPPFSPPPPSFDQHLPPSPISLPKRTRPPSEEVLSSPLS